MSYFVAFIPKVDSSLELVESMHIPLLGSLYKLVVKVLAYRLARTIDSLISLE